MAYQPRKKVKIAAEIQGEPISVVFIPRKPHPNGLEIFLVTTPVKKTTIRKNLCVLYQSNKKQRDCSNKLLVINTVY
jgi:hypothetical protein